MSNFQSSLKTNKLLDNLGSRSGFRSSTSSYLPTENENFPLSRVVEMNGQNAKFDHAITALGFGVLGTLIACFGIVMTVLAYVVEKPADYKSVAEGYGLRTDIAGPVLLSLGGTGILICAAMVVAGACSTPEWARRKSSIALDNNSEH